ncbi:MAG: flagellar hook assembly protein FlgD [Rhodobacteraceae bacterium]|nr:flagellar hook assembly protein FlgD [Paracoccaceae bacterium]
MINEVSTTVTLPPSQTASVSQTLDLASDFDTFLKMLTAQAKYQDPMDPISSSEYASQLAQFSAVEQQVLTNDTLQLISEQLSGSNISSLANWVGMEARAVTPAFFDGSAPITLSPNPAAVADRVELVVYDENGVEVQRNAIPVSAQPVEWAGLDDDGNPLPEGTYSFTVESFADDELILSEQAEVYSRVTEAQVLNGDIILILEGGQAVLSSSVTGLRDP